MLPNLTEEQLKAWAGQDATLKNFITFIRDVATAMLDVETEVARLEAEGLADIVERVAVELKAQAYDTIERAILKAF